MSSVRWSKFPRHSRHPRRRPSRVLALSVDEPEVTSVPAPPPRFSDPCPACNEADLVQKGSKMGCPRTECWYVQPCCQPG